MLINIAKIMEGLTCRKNIPFVLLMCFAYFHTVTSAPTKTVLDSMNICPTVSFIQGSNYTAECSKQIFRDDVKGLSHEADDLAMCLMVYDIVKKICTYSSKIPVESDIKFNLPETAKLFDDDVKKLEPETSKYESFMTDFCKNVPSMSNKVSTIDETKNIYLTYVNGSLLNKEECPHTCYKHGSKVNPLCMVLLWANELFSSIKPFKTPNNKSEILPNKNDIPPADGVDIDQAKQKPNESQKSVTKIVAKEKSIKNNEEHVVEQEKDVKSQKEQIVESSPIKNADKPENANLNVANNDNKPLNPSNVQNSQDEPKLVPEVPKAEDAAKDDTNLPLPSNNDNIDAVPKQINAPPEINNPPNEANGENEADIQNGKMDDKIIDVDEGKEADNAEVRQENPEPIEQVKSIHPNAPKINEEEEESHSFTYFSIICLFIVGFYVGYHNKQKILAMVLEGRRSRRNRGSRRRPSTASYRKLDCNLEEAVTSQCNSNVTHVIY